MLHKSPNFAQIMKCCTSQQVLLRSLRIAQFIKCYCCLLKCFVTASSTLDWFLFFFFHNGLHTIPSIICDYFSSIGLHRAMIISLDFHSPAIISIIPKLHFGTICSNYRTALVICQTTYITWSNFNHLENFPLVAFRGPRNHKHAASMLRQCCNTLLHLRGWTSSPGGNFPTFVNKERIPFASVASFSRPRCSPKKQHSSRRRLFFSVHFPSWTWTWDRCGVEKTRRSWSWNTTQVPDQIFCFSFLLVPAGHTIGPATWCWFCCFWVSCSTPGKVRHYFN